MSFNKVTDNTKLGLGFSLRLSLYYGAFAALLAFGIFAIAYLSIAGSVRETEYQRLQESAETYRRWYIQGGVEYMSSRLREEIQRYGELFFVRVVGPGIDLQQIRYSGDLVDFDQLRAPKPGSNAQFQIRFGEDEANTWTIIEEPFANDTTIQLGRCVPGGAAVLERFKKAVSWAAIPALLIGVLGGTALTFRAMGPIRRLIGTISTIVTTGDLDQRVQSRKGFNEFNALVSLFNKLLSRNQKLVTAMRDSLDSVAHDLRTPMMRLRVSAEGTLPKIKEPLAREALGEVLEESDDILRMLTLLMDLSEAESGALKLDLEEVHAAEILIAVSSLYEFVAEDKEIALEVNADSDITLNADPTRLRQAVANLVDNAIKYSPTGSRVILSADADNDVVSFRVRDEGEGIAENEQQRIWKRLYRVDQSRSEPGLGLGLSFVHAIAKAHGGRAEVQSTIGEGSTFSLVLPKSL